jgi:hypothetical protein
LTVFLRRSNPHIQTTHYSTQGHSLPQAADIPTATDNQANRTQPSNKASFIHTNKIERQKKKLYSKNLD